MAREVRRRVVLEEAEDSGSDGGDVETGNVIFQIRNENNDPVTDVVVRLEEQDTDAEVATKSDSNGIASFCSVPIMEYEASFEHPDYDLATESFGPSHFEERSTASPQCSS